jgi:hypothetical protein
MYYHQVEDTKIISSILQVEGIWRLKGRECSS